VGTRAFNGSPAQLVSICIDPSLAVRIGGSAFEVGHGAADVAAAHEVFADEE